MDFIATDYEHKDIHEDARTVGIVSGTFAPFHAGHKRLVDAAAKDNDLVIVIVGGHENDRGRACGFPQKERYKRLRCAYENEPDIMVAMLNEDKTYEFSDPVGLAKYHDGVCEIARTYAPNYELIRNYVGQQDYYDVVAPAYPDFENILVSRSTEKPCDVIAAAPEAIAESMSATAIRENPYANWGYIDDAFKYAYRKTYIFSGAMSTGKTTISSTIANIINSGALALAGLDDEHGEQGVHGGHMRPMPQGCILVPETARSYTEGWRHIIESDLNERDYLAFIADQLAAMEDAKMFNSPEQVVLIDTDGVTTKQYIENDDEAIDARYAKSLSDICDISIKWTSDNADLVFIMPNDVDFVLDGSRDGHIANKRDEFRQQLIDRYNEIVPGKVVLVPEGGMADKLAFILHAIIDDFAK